MYFIDDSNIYRGIGIYEFDKKDANLVKYSGVLKISKVKTLYGENYDHAENIHVPEDAVYEDEYELIKGIFKVFK